MGSEEDVDFFAYAEDVDKAEALVAAVTALSARTPYPYPKDPWNKDKISISTRDGSQVSREECSLEEMIELIRQHFTPSSYAHVALTTEMPAPIFQGPHWAGPWLSWAGSADRSDDDRHPFGGLSLGNCEIHGRLRQARVAPVHQKCPIPVAAALQMSPLRLDAEFILLGLCSSPRIKTGGMSIADIEHRDGYNGYCAPLELAATFNADHDVARDLALSWLELHNGLRIAYKVAGLPLDELAARVEAAPKGTKIGLSRSSKGVYDHYYDECKRDPNTCDLPIELWRRGPREIFPADDLLSREHVLAVLKTPSEELLSALEAAAAKPDKLWLEAERGAHEVLEEANKISWEERIWIDVDELEHRYFLGEYAPYEVKRLETGGVLMMTHYYRTLWPLWSDALALLGIRPQGWGKTNGRPLARQSG